MKRKKPYVHPASEMVELDAQVVLQNISNTGNNESFTIDDPGGSWMD